MDSLGHHEGIEKFYKSLLETLEETIKNELLTTLSKTSDEKRLVHTRELLQEEGHIIPESSERLKTIIEIIDLINMLPFNRRAVIAKLEDKEIQITGAEAAIILCHCTRAKGPFIMVFANLVNNDIIKYDVNDANNGIIKYDINDANIISYAERHNIHLPVGGKDKLEKIAGEGNIARAIIKCNTTREINYRISKVEKPEQAVAILSSQSKGIYGDRGIAEEETFDNGVVTLQGDFLGREEGDDNGNVQNERLKTKEEMDIIQEHLGSLITTREDALAIQQSRDNYPAQDAQGRSQYQYISPQLKNHIRKLITGENDTPHLAVV